MTAPVGNVMYLCCKHCPRPEQSFLLSERGEAMNGAVGYQIHNKRIATIHVNLNKWLERHASCGGTVDHFTIAYAQATDHDVPKANPVRDAVHLHLVPKE